MRRTNRTTSARDINDWRPVFLAELAKEGTVYAACKNAGIGRTTAYDERHRNTEFATAWNDVEATVTDKLERRAVELALAGDGHLLMHLLKARRREVYGDASRVEVQHTGRIEIAPVEVPDTNEYRQRVAEIAGRAMGELPEAASNGNGNGHR